VWLAAEVKDGYLDCDADTSFTSAIRDTHAERTHNSMAKFDKVSNSEDIGNRCLEGTSGTKGGGGRRVSGRLPGGQLKSDARGSTPGPTYLMSFGT